MTDQPTPETDAQLADDTQPSSDSPDYVRALEIHIHLLRAELADERAKKSDALIVAHNDALLRLHVTTAERDAARAEVAHLRAALEHYRDCAVAAQGMRYVAREALNQAAQ